MTRFPDDFLWGAATAAYQIEGAPLADGAGPSIWQRFTHDPRLMIARGDTGDVACDHYHRWREDVALMKALGLGAYRFSVAWGRVLPEGTGRVNEAGLSFYERLVDELLASGIAPMPTLYHWDLPAALNDKGGWLNRDSADWFADYARVLFERLDGRVTRWVTLYEPWVVADGGYLNGVLAPGHRNLFEAPIASRNLMRAHGRAVEAYRATGAHEIGLVVNIEPKIAASDSAEDQAARRRAEAYMNRQYLDPAIHGRTPPEMPAIFGEAWTDWSPDDLALAHQPIDFLGINYYTRAVVRADDDAFPTRAAPVPQPAAARMTTGWEIDPQAFTDMLLWVRSEYGAIPLYITENGAAFHDPPRAIAGTIDDPLRIAYLRAHIAAMGAAIDRGVDVRGYMLWSLFDNFEWALGYAQRFGIVHVDYETMERTPKNSAHFYRAVIAANATPPGG